VSTKASSAVWELRGLVGSELLVMLRLAEVAHDDGSNAFLSVQHVADDCGLHRSTVQRTLHRLVEVGMLAVQYEARSHRPTVYRLTIPGLRTLPDPVDVGSQDATQARPKRGAAGSQRGSAEVAEGPRRGSVGVAHTLPDPDPEPYPDPEPDPQTPLTPRKRGEPVNEDFIQELIIEYRGVFDETRVREEIEGARNSKSWDGWKDKRLGVRGWLRRAKRWQSERVPSKTYAQQESNRSLNHGPYAHLINRENA